MRRSTGFFLFFSLVVLTCVSSAGGSITYNLVNYPADQDGWTLSGQITTDGNTGLLSSSDIDSWSFALTSPSNSVYQASSQGMNQNPIFNGLWAESGNLEVDYPTDSNTPGYVNLQSNDASGKGALLQYYRAYAASGGIDQSYLGEVDTNSGWQIAFLTFYPDMGGVSGGAEPWIIATASTVPEPATLTIFGALLGLAGVVYLRRRGRKLA